MKALFAAFRNGPLCLVLFVLVASMFAIGVCGSMMDGDFDDPSEYDPEEAMMRAREGMGPEERVTIGVVSRPKECTKKVQEGSKVAVELTLSKVVPSETKPGETEKVEVLSKKPKLIIVGSGRFLEGVENGIVGACIGEVRTLRIPASLGFSETGSKKLNVPPETDLRAVVKVEDFEDPDPYGEDMDDMSPDEDMDAEDSAKDGDEDDEDDSEKTTGPDIAEDDFFHYVQKIDTEQLAEKIAQKNVAVMFYAPWCGHCTAVKPKFAKVARAFQSESSVAVVAIDATEDEEAASAFGIEGFPTIMFFKKGSQKPTTFQGARTATAMVKSINHEFNTERLPNGRLTELAGTVGELNELVVQWQAGTLSLKDLGNQLPQGSYYKRVVEGIQTHGINYVSKEKARLIKMMSASHSVKPEQLDSMQRRVNILDVFHDEREPEL